MILLFLILVACGSSDQPVDNATAKGGPKTHAVNLAWDIQLDPTMPQETVASFILYRSGDCRSWQVLAQNLVNLFYTDTPPFSWHQACYQLVALGTLGDHSPPSNHVLTTW